MSTLNRPVKFPGTDAQAKANFHTHYWTTPDGENYSCGRCDAKPWHAAAEYPCGEEPERETITFTPNYVDGCESCDIAKAAGQAPIPAHGNCLYAGRDVMGHHPEGHCTADACY